MKYLWMFLLVAKVTIPWGVKITYDNVEKVLEVGQTHYHLLLADGRDVYVPTMFTVIEEAK